MAKSYLNNPDLPRGLRNNNPGNLRRLPKRKDGSDQLWHGEIKYAQSEDASFSQFIDLKSGIRAMMKDIYGDFTRGLNNVTALIGNYAPPNENNTKAYINSVAKTLGILATAPFLLTYERMLILCEAIVLVENGAGYADYITRTDYEEALAISGLPLKKKLTK